MLQHVLLSVFKLSHFSKWEMCPQPLSEGPSPCVHENGWLFTVILVCHCEQASFPLCLLCYVLHQRCLHSVESEVSVNHDK